MRTVFGRATLFIVLSLGSVSLASATDDTDLSSLCDTVADVYHPRPNDAFLALSEAARTAREKLATPVHPTRVRGVQTLAEFFVFLLRSPAYQTYHSRAASVLRWGNRVEEVRLIAADPDAAGQAAAISTLASVDEEPAEELFLSVVKAQPTASPQARAAAVRSLRTRLYKVSTERAQEIVRQLLDVLSNETDSQVAREAINAALFLGGKTDPEFLGKLFAYCRDPQAKFKSHALWTLALFAEHPSVRLLILELTQSLDEELRNTAVRSLGRVSPEDSARHLEGIATGPSTRDRSTALLALSQLAGRGDEASFLALVRIFRAGFESGYVLSRTVQIWFQRPEWFLAWSKTHLEDLGALFHAWVELLSEGSSQRSEIMRGFEKLWDLLPARESETLLFSELGLVYDEDHSIPPDLRAGALLFGGVPANISVRRVRAPTDLQKQLFHERMTAYTQDLARLIDSP